jgi:hypothetical protein
LKKRKNEGKEKKENEMGESIDVSTTQPSSSINETRKEERIEREKQE